MVYTYLYDMYDKSPKLKKKKKRKKLSYKKLEIFHQKKKP